MNKILMIIVLCVIFSGCSKENSNNEQSNIKVEIEKMAERAGFEKYKIDSLKEIEIAENYGINPDKVNNGYVCKDGKDKSSEFIMLFECDDKEETEELQKIFEQRIGGMENTYESRSEERKKFDNKIIKSKAGLMIFAVTEKADEVENIFNEMA